VDLFSVLKQAGSGAVITGSRTGLRAALVVTQVALAFALSTSGGLALKALTDTLRRPAGFEPEGLVTGRLMGIPPEYDQPMRRNKLYAQVMERIRATPGVQSVAANVALPLSGYTGEFEMEIEGWAAPPARLRPIANRNVVTQNYLETLRIPVLQGRAFLPAEEADSAPVAIISKHLAEAYFPGKNPIGRHIRHGGPEEPWREIVGVVGDVRRNGLAAPIRPETYLPIYPEVGALVIVARTDHPAHLLEELPRVVASVNPVLGVWSRRMDERMQDTLLEAYRVSVVLGVFALVALLLAALGLYALVSYTTALKTREFGIRMALGSPPRALVWRVMRSALVWLGLGSALGLLAGLAIGKALALGISGVRGFDLEVYALVALSLGFTGALASFVPALRTLRISPASALRYE
jgi:putative ABC transport system permease protein